MTHRRLAVDVEPHRHQLVALIRGVFSTLLARLVLYTSPMDKPVRPRRPNRARPMVAFTVAADVDTEIRTRAERERRPVSHVVETLLRAALALPEPAPGGAAQGE